jgi:hypothetical protein
MRDRDPLKDIPKERHLDYKVVDEPLASLSTALLNKLEREWPPALARVDGAQTLFRCLSFVAAMTCQTVVYICADKPDDPARKLSFASSAPPLLRSLLDGLCTVVFIAEDLEKMVAWYYRSGWREVAERNALYGRKYGGDLRWKEWLAEGAALAERMRKSSGITQAELANPKLVRYWPTLPQMIHSRDIAREIGSERRQFLEYLEAWFYRELSQASHLTFPGLSHRAAPFLRERDDPIAESQWRKLRSDAVGVAMVLLLAFITEVNDIVDLDLRSRCAYLWGILREYFPFADELFQARYAQLLNQQPPANGASDPAPGLPPE